MTAVLERAEKFLDINDIQTKTIFEVLDLSPTACLIIKESSREAVWYNRAFAEKYSLRLPNMDGQTVPQMFGCVSGPDIRRSAFGDCCADCPMQTAVVNLKKGIQTGQRGVVTVPAPWGKTDLHVETYAYSLNIQNKVFLLLYIKDTENEAVRYQLNRSFFHDLLNIGQQLRSSVNLSRMIIEDAKRDGYRVPTQLNKELKLLDNAVAIITDKVNQERQLNNAQNDTLIPHVVSFKPQEILQELLQSARKMDEHGGRLLVIVPCPYDYVCTSDRMLLEQVCYALMHTLIYSSRAEQIIELGFTPQAETLDFWFRNRELSLNANKLKQFKTEYSLKRTRNVYSYTISVLARKYLQASISISSNESEGTTISLSLPLQAASV